MLNDFTGGGQIFLHKLRMFFQVLHRSFMTSLLISLAIVGFISYKPAQILDLKAAMTYQKALLADGFDEASRGIRQTINPRAKYYYTTIDAHSKKGLDARDLDPRKIIKSNFYRAAYLEARDFLKVRLVFTALVMCGIFLLIYLLWSRFGRDVKSEKKKEGSGRILSAREASSILKSINKAGHFYIGAMALVKDSETKHFLVTGSTGCGKTNLIHNILPQVEKKKQPAIIIDQTGEMIAKYYNPTRGDIIFNPFDKRAKSWDFWSDCHSCEELERFAKILFGFNRKRTGHSADPFWEQSAESLFIACTDYQRSTGDLRIEQLCSLVRGSSLGILQAKLKNTDASRYLESDNKTTASSILSVLATNAKPLSYLRDTMPCNSFSLKEHFKNIDKGAGNWLFLATKPSSRELTLALIACISELAFSRLLDIGIKEDRRIWFVIDELSALGKLPSLPTLMAEGRKYGACVLSGLQSLNQLYSNYGQYEGSTIFGQFGTNFFFRNNEPAIAKTVSSICGRETIYRQQKNTSFGAHEFRDEVSYSEQQQQKDLVEYSDLASLATGECFVLLPEPQVRIVKLQTTEVKLPNKNAGFMQSENLTTELQAEDVKQDMNDIDEENKELDEPSDQQDSKRGSSQSLSQTEQKKEQDFDLESGLIKH
jgi:type IV conjugative transfer system coupling protein TraD